MLPQVLSHFISVPRLGLPPSNYAVLGGCRPSALSQVPHTQGGEDSFQRVSGTEKETPPPQSRHIHRNGLCEFKSPTSVLSRTSLVHRQGPSGILILSMEALAYISHRTHGRKVSVVSAPAGGRSSPDQQDLPKQPGCAEHLPPGCQVPKARAGRRP